MAAGELTPFPIDTPLLSICLYSCIAQHIRQAKSGQICFGPLFEKIAILRNAVYNTQINWPEKSLLIRKN